MSVTLILGGARSGKSQYAHELADMLGGRVLYVATAEALDEEMSSRIEAHKRSRPSSWRTLEVQTDVAEAIRSGIGDAEVVIIDCLTLLVSNLMSEEDLSAEALEEKVAAELEDIIALMGNMSSHFIIVSNELGLGLVPLHPSGRAYRDVLGLANQMLARRADEVYLMIAGIPLVAKKEDIAK
ncbi:MAG: bifunctional adenosylcobinamide kinase/adenosylcobinamide-phosphate guanylyltransferase [Dehalococcoidia bacterium]